MHYLHEYGRMPDEEEMDSGDMMWIRAMVGHTLLKHKEVPTFPGSTKTKTKVEKAIIKDREMRQTNLESARGADRNIEDIKEDSRKECWMKVGEEWQTQMQQK